MKKMHRLMLPLLAAVALPAMVEAAPVAAVPAAASAPVSFEVYLPLRDTAGLQALLVAQQDESSPSYHQWLTPAQFAARFGPTADTIAAAKTALAAAGLNVTKVNSRSLRVSGTVSSANALLGTSLGTVQDTNGKTRTVAMGKPAMLPALQALGAKVIAFSGVMPHHPLVTKADARAVPENRYGADGPYWFTDLKQAYDYPDYTSMQGKDRLDGTGVSAAVLMEDLASQTDVNNFFNHEKFLANGGAAIPTITTVLLNGGGTANGPGSFEAALDVQQVSSGAPGATTTLISLPDLSDDNITDGYNYIVNSNKYDIVSSSFGECELFYTAEYNNGTDQTGALLTYEELFQQGNAQGTTFLASSGDNGGLECTDTKYINGGTGKFIKGVSTPAASRHVTAVGGGNLVTAAVSGSLDSTYVSENGFGDPLNPYDPYGVGGKAKGGYWGAGGGISTIFAALDAQKKKVTGSAMRTVPDIGMQVGGCPGGGEAITPCHADDSAAVVAYGGSYYGVIGTSVSSPELAGAVALYIQKMKGRVGDINPYLYKKGAQQTAAGGMKAPAESQFYHRNNPGYDGVYSSSTPSNDYNYIFGNGSPDVRLLFGLTKYSAAGVPQTSSNP
jgi:subtilase family serine protease